MGKRFDVDDAPPQAQESLQRLVLTLLRQSWERNRSVKQEEAKQVVSETIQEVRKETTRSRS